MYFKKITLLFFLIFAANGFSQTLSLKEAIKTGLENYGAIKAKSNYTNASRETLKQSKRDYLPNLNLSAQQDYGTVNGQNGPLYGFGGLGVASSGLPLPEQNWNSAFGALYLVNMNWDFFTFGKIQEKINLAKIEVNSKEKDLQQEQFQQKIKITAAYLNLLASQRLLISQQKNLSRAEVFKRTAAARVKNGLLAGVDSTLATAEVSKAKIALNLAKNFVKEQNNKLVDLMGIAPQDFATDTLFVNQIPRELLAGVATDSLHPLLQFYKTKMDYSNQQVKLFKRFYYPTMTAFGVLQTRASGFDSSYATDQTAFTRNYWDGINPDRTNYLVGVGITWNLTTPFRSSKQVSAQKLVSQALQEEYNQIDRELKSQLNFADDKIKVSLENVAEAPIQVNAARQAYLQKSTLYKNGLTTLTDLTQIMYTLNRAEIDRDIVNNNVWQSFLLKVAATGNFDLFINEF
ncbi:TolC family protein [Flavobacterium sp. Fl-77]|uniref:TolC family protein n=1 Tax=Flavobacterium flavipigmentatum TaxID=2893884 RepID=A0AAJ2SDH6_9FLAO|nr:MULTISPECIES: TolC family protein [unclassified Flavobacterium]MDX6183592.1 TolC family protein [Flavobacterium sp. Fl-33]MDX6187144.1 TolC family protein [Flavobacterium sp. Fl-77]UFH38045.1 TolC family protein [Flavobacterium sp. F-70]